MADPINRALMAHRPLFLSGLLLDGQFRLPPAKPGRNHSQPASGLAAALAIAAAARRSTRGITR